MDQKTLMNVMLEMKSGAEDPDACYARDETRSCSTRRTPASCATNELTMLKQG